MVPALGIWAPRPLTTTMAPTITLLGLGLFVAVSAGAVFYLTLSRYQRVSGYSVDIALLRTAAFVIILVAIGTLAWWGSGLLFAPGRARNVTMFLGFSLLESTLGRGALFLATALIERWFHR